jgi:transcriptional activator for dhaKLM operon
MQPAERISNEIIARIWQHFVETGSLNGVRDAHLLDRAVLRSWHRCVARLNPYARPRLTPTKGQALASLRRAQSDLISTAVPLMEDIFQFTEGSESAILLTDGTTCVLAVHGDPAAVRKIEELGLGEGTYWSEGQLGTNAFGIVLDSAMPAQLIGAEHYFKLYHQFTTSAAPIHDVRGRIIGIFGIVSPAAQAYNHTLALAMSAARAVSNQLQAEWSLQEANHRLSEVNTILEAIAEGVIAWNVAGEINHINTHAAQMLAINPMFALGRSLEQVLELPPVMAEAIANGRELHNVEVNFHVNSNTVRSLVNLVSLRSMGDAAGEAVGYIAMLSPIEQVRQLVQQQAGTQASITIKEVHGESPLMRQVLRQARIAARGKAPVLLRGEGGVGKNHLAQAIHNDGARAGKPYVAINCRAIPHELMASELLGREKDTASHGRPSKFELAEGGTLLLDQVESLSLEMQSALLQVIETGHVMRLRGTHPIAVDVRITVATNADLEKLVSEGSFLAHLYYRFGVFNISMPPLRERIEDIPLLARRILGRVMHHNGSTQLPRIDDEALAILMRYPWPGNVRELESVLERAVYQSTESVIHVADLPDSVRQGRLIVSRSPQPQPVLSVPDAEREAILQAGWACNGRISEMAQLLQIGRTTLWRKMKRYSIRSEQFREAPF